jgi:hypothetical protein
MERTGVDVFYESSKNLINFLDTNKQVSYRNDVDNSFKKVLTLSAASYFEGRIKSMLMEFIAERSSNDVLVTTFVNNKAIADKYFQLFDFRNRQINGFFSCFGEEFKKYMIQCLKEDSEMKKASDSFLEIGHWRDRLVHQNFAEYDFQKTGDEVYQLFNDARKFVPFIKIKLREFQAASGVDSD